MNIIATPAARGRYFAHLDGRLICTSKTPFFSSARILELEQVRGATPLTMTHGGSDTVCLTSTVAQAAALMVVENDAHGPRVARYRAPPTHLR